MDDPWTRYSELKPTMLDHGQLGCRAIRRPGIRQTEPRLPSEAALLGSVTFRNYLSNLRRSFDRPELNHALSFVVRYAACMTRARSIGIGAQPKARSNTRLNSARAPMTALLSVGCISGFLFAVGAAVGCGSVRGTSKPLLQERASETATDSASRAPATR